MAKWNRAIFRGNIYSYSADDKSKFRSHRFASIFLIDCNCNQSARTRISALLQNDSILKKIATVLVWLCLNLLYLDKAWIFWFFSRADSWIRSAFTSIKAVWANDFEFEHPAQCSSRSHALICGYLEKATVFCAKMPLRDSKGRNSSTARTWKADFECESPTCFSSRSGALIRGLSRQSHALFGRGSVHLDRRDALERRQGPK